MAGPWEQYQNTEGPWSKYQGQEGPWSKYASQSPSEAPQSTNNITPEGRYDVSKIKAEMAPLKETPSFMDYISGGIPGTFPHAILSGLTAPGDVATGTYMGKPVYDETGTQYDPRDTSDSYMVGRTLETGGFGVRGSVAKLPKYSEARANVNVEKLKEETYKGMAEGLNPQRALQESAKKLKLLDRHGAPITPKVAKKIEDLTIKNQEDQMWAEHLGHKEVPPIDSKAEIPYNNILVDKVKSTVGKYGGDWVSEKTSNLIRSISDRVEEYSPKLGNSLRRFELDSSVAIHKGMLETDSFKESFASLSKTEQRQFKKLIVNEDKEGIDQFLTGRPELKAGWDQTQNYLKGALSRLRDAGYDLPDKDIYFPRVVKDYNKLIRDLSGQEHDQLTRIYRDAIQKKGYFLRLGEEPEKYLTDVEISELNNKFFRNKYYGGRVGTTSAVKERTVSNVPEHVLDAYDDPIQAIHKYVRHVEHNVEKRKFFGYGGVKYSGDERQSIGELVRLAREQGDIRTDKVDQVEKLLAARFEGGEKPIADWARNSKNVFYTAFLGQPSAAVTQIGDLGVSTYLHGFTPTIKGMVGPKWASVDDLGIRLAAKEMEDTGKMANIMHKALKWSGFQAMDRLGKNTQINAAFRKYNKMAQSPIGEGRIRQKYRHAFTPEEMDKLMVALREKKVTPETKMLLWTELSNSQPISLSELPKWYLEHPNARILYMLQTFTTKQMSLFYKDALKKMASGNPKEMAVGAKNAAVYVSILTAANLGAEKSKELLRLRAPTDVESAAIANTVWRNFGLSEYVIDKLQSDNKQDVVYGIASIFGSPLTAAASIKQDVEKGLFDDDYSYLRALKHLPVGSVAYMWFGGGLEESEKAQEFKLRKQELEEMRND